MKLKGETKVPAFFELRPDQLLIDPNFQGYKLSLEPFPSYVIPFETGIDHASPTDDQFTMQHAKLSALNNHVIPDLWNPGCFYIVDSTWNLYKSILNHQNPGTLCKTWTIPDTPMKKPGRFNVSLSFPDDNHAVCSDGSGTLYILETGARNLTQYTDWKVIFQQYLFEPKQIPQFLVLDSVRLEGRQPSVLDVLLLRIDERVEWKEFLEFHQDPYLASSEHPFVSVLEWITFAQDANNALQVASSRSLVGRSGVEYAVIERNGFGVYIASEDPFYFAFDSIKPIQPSIASKISDSEEKSGIDVPSSPDYMWYQTATDINVWFRLPEESRKHDLLVDFKPSSISVEFKKQVILSGKLFAGIKSVQSTWTLEAGRLEITLIKCIEGIWDEFVLGDKNGERVEDPTLVDKIHDYTKQTSSERWGADPHNLEVYDPQGLEECDEYPPATAALTRIGLNEQRITNRTTLDSHQWLFSAKHNPGEVACLCVRHDIDAMVWQPQEPVEKRNEAGDSVEIDWNCKHLATFSALGYLQAAKERKKFTLSSPDFSYAVICDDVKHIYVYRQPSPIQNNLRNRKTGVQVSHVAKQHLIALDPPLEIMGAYAGIEWLFILTSRNLHLIRMKAVEEI